MNNDLLIFLVGFVLLVLIIVVFTLLFSMDNCVDLRLFMDYNNPDNPNDDLPFGILFGDCKNYDSY